MAIANKNWSTKRLKDFQLNYKLTGIIPDDHPFFNREIGKKKSGINWGYTQEELVELIKCEEDIIYFANNYCKILTEEGRKLLKEVGGLRWFQEDMLRQYQKNKYNITLASRQIGKSITVAIYVCWYVLFHSDINILLLSATGKKAKDLLAKIKDIQDALPFFMQVGLKKDDVQRRMYDNGCVIESENTTENSGVSGTYGFIYWDEMALLEAEMQEKIFTGAFPTMASYGDKAKFIITSTPRGRRNKFYKIWTGAIAEPDSPIHIPFAYSKIYWYDVEGRDEAWAREEKKIMGETGFAREYDLSFDAEEDMLIDDELKKVVTTGQLKYKRHDLVGGILNLKLRPDFEIEYFSDVEKKFHISIDLAGGKKRDYTVFNIFEIIKKDDNTIRNLEFFESELDFFMQRQVGIIRSNKYKPDVMAKYLCQILDKFFDVENDNVKLTIEMNHKGDHFRDKIFSWNGTLNPIKEYQDQLVIQYPRHCDFDDDVSYEDGITQSTKSKKIATDNINYRLQVFDIEITEDVTIDEGLSFGLNKKGNYEGLSENDDCFMTTLNAIHFFKTEEYAEWVDFLYDALYPQERLLMDELLEKSEGDSAEDWY